MATQSNVPMVSEVSICNQALSWIGQHEISSLDEKSPSAQWCRNNYPFIRDSVIEARMWTFATVKDSSTTANLDAWGQNFVHDKPLEWLSVFRVYRDVSSDNPRNWTESRGWRMEEDKINTPDSTIYMWGVKRITDTSKFSPMFVQALAARLAADIAIAITKSRPLQSDMWGLYQQKLDEATARDGQQGDSDKLKKGRMVSLRGGRI